jgi:DNA-binding transcriptional regulator YdaS (Cro superfamily)
MRASDRDPIETRRRLPGDAKLRRLFEAAASQANEKQKSRASDESMVRWLAQQVGERGVKAMADLLGYDQANLGKVVLGKRRLSSELRNRISEQMTVVGLVLCEDLQSVLRDLMSVSATHAGLEINVAKGGVAEQT